MSPRRYLPAVVAVACGLISASAQAETIQITMDKLVFAPAETAAKVGDTVAWINNDILVHTATARNGDWDVNIGAKKTAELVLKKAGTIEYYCRFHPNMKGRITIAPQ